MASAKKQTKQDLEAKIAELEAKLNQLSDQLTSKPAETKPAEVKPILDWHSNQTLNAHLAAS